MKIFLIQIRVFSVCIFAMGILCHFQSAAQDLQFSQYFNSPLLTNPANTGFIPASDFRVGANFRNQWNASPGGYRTSSIYGDFQVFRDKFPNGWMGLGGVIINDFSGPKGGLMANRVYGSVAYHQMIGVEGLLSLGFNVGYANYMVDKGKFTFGDQWTGTGFTGATSETFNTSTGNLDVQVGLNYAYFPTDNVYFHAGASLMHVNKPGFSFFSNAINRYQMPMRPVVFFDGVIKLNNSIILNPGVYYTNFLNNNQVVGGVHFNLNASGDGTQQLIGGVYVGNSGQSLVPMVGYQWKNFKFMFSYNVASGNLAFYPGTGATEFSLQYEGMYTLINRDRQSMCPAFDH